MPILPENLTLHENEQVAGLRERFAQMRACLNQQNTNDCSIATLFQHLEHLMSIAGNLSNPRSFGACLLAKHYLMDRFDIENFDVAEKPQGASGPDIDVKTIDGRRILAEIKTTVPYEIEQGDIGAAQRTSFRKDWKKLLEAQANHKFFFLTNADAYAIVQRKYLSELQDIEVVLLTW